MEILLVVPFHICIAHMLTKAVFLPQHMIVPSATNALSHIVPARRQESSTLDKQKLDNTTHVNEDCAESNNVRPSMRRKNHISTRPKRPQASKCRSTNIKMIPRRPNARVNVLPSRSIGTCGFSIAFNIRCRQNGVESCSKRLSWAVGPYHVTLPTLYTITIDQDRIPNTNFAIDPASTNLYATAIPLIQCQ